jgi:cytochrome c-type biogenesis protein
MGVAFGFGWTPCIGPVLAAILTLAASEDTVGRGMLLLFAYSMGLGVPFLLASIAVTKAFAVFGWIKAYLRPINVASGLLLAFFGFLMLTGQITRISAWFTKVLTNLGLDGLTTI